MEIAEILALIPVGLNIVNQAQTVITQMINDNRQKSTDEETALLKAAIARQVQADSDFDAAFGVNSDRPPI